ncbi:MAG: diacylglycerol kinase family lipid kinase [Verrucomicrobia bacterium]|nr:diacylglycerol kinase family lipid kinase [Verrucomicrobiota bacterium]
MVKTRFIFNPRSGHNARNPALLDRTRAFIHEHDLPAELVLTERPRHATELARRAIDEGCGLIVAVGGDGTLNEVAAALVGSEAALGLIPCGSGNGLGRHLGIPGPGKGAFRTLLNGRVRTIDTGSANGIPFFNAMGLGFDAEISHRFNRLVRRGLQAYVQTTWATLFGYRPQSYRILNGNAELTTSAFIVAVANSDQYGNDCFIAPGACVDDGRLDLTVIKRANLFNTLPLIERLFTRRIDGSPSVLRLQGSHFTIERPAPGLIHTDGETHETGATVDIVVHPLSLRIMVPEVPSPA